MPSCDGSNCGACSACRTEYRTEYVHLDKKEKEAYEERIKKLEEELKIQKGVNQELIDKILNKKQFGLEQDYGYKYFFKRQNKSNNQ